MVQLKRELSPEQMRQLISVSLPSYRNSDCSEQNPLKTIKRVAS